MLHTLCIIIISVVNSTTSTGTGRTRSHASIPGVHAGRTRSRAPPRKMHSTFVAPLSTHVLQNDISNDAYNRASASVHELARIGSQIQAILTNDSIQHKPDDKLSSDTATTDRSTNKTSTNNITHLLRLDFNTSSNQLDTTEITQVKNRLERANDTISVLQSKIMHLEQKQNNHFVSVIMWCGISTLITGLICGLIMLIMHYSYTKKHAQIKRIQHVNYQMRNAAPVFSNNSMIRQHRDNQHNQEGVQKIKLEKCEVEPGSWEIEKLDKFIPNSVKAQQVLMEDIVGNIVTDAGIIKDNVLENGLISDKEGIDKDNHTVVVD